MALAKPGLLLRPQEGQPPFKKETDRDLLESKLEVKVGEGQVKEIKFSADGFQAHVELEDDAGKSIYRSPKSS